MSQPPFLSQPSQASGSGPGRLDKNVPQESGTPAFNPDSVPAGGRVAIPDKGKYNDATSGKPWKNLGDGGAPAGGDPPADLE